MLKQIKRWLNSLKRLYRQYRKEQETPVPRRQRRSNLMETRRNFKFSPNRVVVKRRMVKKIPDWILAFKQRQLSRKGVKLVISR